MRLKSTALVAGLLASLSAVAHAESQSPLLKDLKFADPALAECVNAWANEDINLYTYAHEVKELACAHSGIQNLDGIEQLPELLALDLSHNPISSYQPLGLLKQRLGFLWLWGNDIRCSELVTLRKLVPFAWIGGASLETCVADEQ